MVDTKCGWLFAYYISLSFKRIGKVMRRLSFASINIVKTSAIFSIHSVLHPHYVFVSRTHYDGDNNRSITL